MQQQDFTDWYFPKHSVSTLRIPQFSFISNKIHNQCLRRRSAHPKTLCPPISVHKVIFSCPGLRVRFFFSMIWSHVTMAAVLILFLPFILFCGSVHQKITSVPLFVFSENATGLIRASWFLFDVFYASCWVVRIFFPFRLYETHSVFWKRLMDISSCIILYL